MIPQTPNTEAMGRYIKGEQFTEKERFKEKVQYTDTEVIRMEGIRC